MSQIDIKTLADNATALAFDLAGQATVATTITTNGGSYNPVTDTTTGGTSYAVKGFLYQTHDQKLAEDAARTATLLVRVASLIAAGFSGDIVNGFTVLINSVLWTVYDVRPDPVKATVTIKIRK